MNKQRLINIIRSFSGFIAILPLVFSFLLSYFQVTPPAFEGQLLFNSSGEFVISTISGLLEGQQGFSKQTRNYINDIVNAEKPDLVVLGGDNIISQPFITDLFLSYTMKTIDEYVNIFEENKVFFTVLFGDFEARGLYNKSAQVKRFMRSPYYVGGMSSTKSISVFTDRRSDIAGNYAIKINGKAKDYYLYIIDYQKEPMKVQQLEWCKKMQNNGPAIYLSYSKLYEIDDKMDISYKLHSKNTLAYVSFDSTNNDEIFINDAGVMLLQVGKTVVNKERVIEREHNFQTIIVKENGEIVIT